ncbi:two-component system, response regulator YesN [Paenibacillus sophorae]|uniref:Response regulator n=1 Tax=Paenibacillus sophorae TaxID=1333845 RepID=A0A1H8P6A7_9BACL|nr:response regulator [Paenibacillus sophorae]QWU16453.1 response regulator [Paenibacillus sophorae]SEO37347.1 two-component system, response regulator YesN [Paenibacillus sophorae]
MNILIVDDEVIIRTGLCTVIDWEELGMTLLPPAESAEEALERIPGERPDIVLTDIRMSGMDGIELAKEIKRRLPDAEIIILTGYDDFGYAQQALREGVTDYLLKTSGPEEVIKAVMKAQRNLSAKREAAKQGAVSAAALRSRLLEEWLTGGGRRSPETAAFEPVRDWLRQNGVFSTEEAGGVQPMRVLLVGASGWGDGRFSELILGSAENRLQELLPCVTLVRNHTVIVALRAEEGWPGMRSLEKTLNRVREMLKCDLFAAAGNIVHSLGELPRSYEEATKVYAYRVLFGDRGLYEMKDIERRRGGRTVCSEKEEQELLGLLIHNHATQLHAWTHRIVEEQLKDPDATPAALQAYLQSVVIVAHRWLDRNREIGASEPAAVPIFTFEPGTRLEDELFRQLLSVMNEFHQGASDSRYSYIQRAIAYIRNHLDQQLSLQQVAGFVHLNPNHFSEVFKRETGQGYMEFVTRERMLRAGSLLLTTQKKIGEIAGEVGYEDMKYFSQQFKKIMGCTPSEYRQANVN